MRRHSTSTLMGMTKKELVEYVRMAEHNQEVAEETLNQQAENVKDWMPVVRCKDCKHFNHQKALRPGGIWCEYWGTDPDPDDFCSYGERRTENGNQA